MSTLFYRYARVTILAIFLLVAAGVAAFFSLGRQEDPSLTERFGAIITPFPGASAERVEALVTAPLEQAILELAEIEELESDSRNGVSIIQMAMRDDLRPDQVDEGWTLIREQVDSVRPQLPQGTGAPDVRRHYMGAATLVIGLTWPEGREPNLAILTRLAADLEDRLG
ncbi:MAG TPA: AcrB/AcrD/AcrF family protein, partial [Alphaproteobacteria bacterium]|nr:AcrB/AcrD/AcrF family protein [Alphaproteobacteria bacterium]